MHGANPFSYWIILDSLSKCSWNTHTRKIYIYLLLTAAGISDLTFLHPHLNVESAHAHTQVQTSAGLTVWYSGALSPQLILHTLAQLFCLQLRRCSAPNIQMFFSCTTSPCPLPTHRIGLRSHIYVRLFIALLKLTSSYILVQMQPRPLVCGCDLEIAKKINK